MSWFLGGDGDNDGFSLGEAKFEMPGGDVQLTANYRGLGLTWPSYGAVGQGG